jgi:flagellar protein FlaG
MDPIKPISFPAVEMDIPVRAIHVDLGSKGSSAEEQKKLEEISRAIQKDVGMGDIRLNYSVNQPTGEIVVTVIDGQSGKVIREIPPQELLALAESMKEFEGLLFNKNV